MLGQRRNFAASRQSCRRSSSIGKPSPKRSARKQFFDLPPVKRQFQHSGRFCSWGDMMNLLCRLGYHFPTRQRLDLTDLELKSRCRLCGAAVGPSNGAADAARSAGRASLDRLRHRPALSLLTIVAFALVLGSAALFAHQAAPRTGASITVKLPPAKPVAAGTALSVNQ